MCGALVVQTLCNFQAIHGVGPIEVLSHPFGFVALNRTDAVPNQGGDKVVRAQGLDFVDAFLDVVFTKVSLPTGCDFGHI